MSNANHWHKIAHIGRLVESGLVDLWMKEMGELAKQENKKRIRQGATFSFYSHRLLVWLCSLSVHSQKRIFHWQCQGATFSFYSHRHLVWSYSLSQENLPLALPGSNILILFSSSSGLVVFTLTRESAREQHSIPDRFM